MMDALGAVEKMFGFLGREHLMRYDYAADRGKTNIGLRHAHGGRLLAGPIAAFANHPSNCFNSPSQTCQTALSKYNFPLLATPLPIQPIPLTAWSSRPTCVLSMLLWVDLFGWGYELFGKYTRVKFDFVEGDMCNTDTYDESLGVVNPSGSVKNAW